MSAIICAIFATLTWLGALGVPSVTGQWDGYMQRDGDRLSVRFDFSDVPARGTFSSTDLGAIDIPLQHVTVSNTVHWELVGDTTTTVFDGKAQRNSITGTFSENGRTGNFSLRRVADTAELPYIKQDVTFRNGSVQLAGTVFVPRTGLRHPALIFVHGSGDEGRWASAYLADYAARHGIVALTYDKRGVGASTGNWRTSTVDDLVNDARAGIAMLARTPQVDRRRIGVWGHSQGGQLAPAIAAHNALVSFVIDADGPVGPQYLQDLYRVNNLLARRYSGKQLDQAEHLYSEFVDVARSGAPHDRLRADIAAAGDAPWVADLAIPDDNNWIWAWYKAYGNYDNRKAWAGVRVPVLIVFGGNDLTVPVQSSVAQTVGILKRHGNANVSVRIFAGADHTLHIPPRTAGGWPHLPGGFPDAVTNFVLGSDR
ncbi:MAG TPA: alpha/beta hydrolase [Candidatus Rubrimentiphilum sp.]|nr:alpha/beta hydrolase [Candidatus Rubrimentiphilum sp.]